MRATITDVIAKLVIGVIIVRHLNVQLIRAKSGRVMYLRMDTVVIVHLGIPGKIVKILVVNRIRVHQTHQITESALFYRSMVIDVIVRTGSADLRVKSLHVLLIRVSMVIVKLMVVHTTVNVTTATTGFTAKTLDAHLFRV